MVLARKAFIIVKTPFIVVIITEKASITAKKQNSPLYWGLKFENPVRISVLS